MTYSGHTKRQDTPWGLADHIERVDGNITFYGTPSHGGYKVQDESAIPEALRKTAHGWAGWYEEDCDAAIVVAFYPDAFPNADLDDVLLILYAYNRPVYDYVTDVA